MFGFKFENVSIESFGLHFPDREVASVELEDRLSPLYRRLGIPFGTLERLSGVKTRYLWEVGVAPSAMATEAARVALKNSTCAPSDLGAIINCSVTRDFFEPATACLVHRNLELSESCMAMDVTNACIGFSNGLMLMGNLIERGVIEAGLLVSAENITRIVESTTNFLVHKDDVTREELLRMLPTFTLGCGAVAMVLTHRDRAPKGHRILGGVARSATQYNDLCNGNGDFCFHQPQEMTPIMHTEASTLIASAAKVGARAWGDASKLLGWSRQDVQHIFCHQVGKQVNEAFYTEMGLDLDKEFTIYRRYGNLVSAALPTALAVGAVEKGMKQGENVLLTAFGSGLNALFTGIKW